MAELAEKPCTPPCAVPCRLSPSLSAWSVVVELGARGDAKVKDANTGEPISIGGTEETPFNKPGLV